MSTEIIFVESQLAALSDHISEGVKVRSKVQRLEQGECPTCFFFRLEKEWVEWNCVTSILDSDGIAVSSRADVEKAHVDFYSDLFSAEDIDRLVKICFSRVLLDLFLSQIVRFVRVRFLLGSFRPP